MATLPKATTVVTDTAGAVAGGLDTICVIAPVAISADATPRQYGSASAIYAQHGYSEGVEYAALHAERTRKPILFVGLPIATVGAISRQDTSGNTGACVTTLATNADGVLSEHEGVLSVVSGGVVGTDQIVLGLSLDGGRSTRRIRLGTATSYVLPFVNITASFTVASLVAGDVIHTWHASGPRSDATGWAAAREALAAQQKAFRSVLLVGDLQTDTEASAYLAQLDAYETENERFVFGRANVLDRLPLAAMTQERVAMQGTPTITFAEVGATGDTITRSSGSWLADGFRDGDTITVTNSASNNVTGVVATVSAIALTLGTLDLVAEGPVSGVHVTGTPTLTFASVVAAGDTLTRSRGSWRDDGFRAGDLIAVTGTVSNNITAVAGAASVTDHVITFGTTDLAAEVIGSYAVAVKTGQTKTAWMAAIDAEFATIDDAPRISLGAGRGAVLSPFSGWNLRQPASWAASLREYQHDLQIAPWRKSDGPVRFDLFDADGTLVEWDDRVDGGAGLAARFTVLRTWANGPTGAFVALSLTRATDGSLLSLTHNMAVINLAQTTCQLNTENVIGRSLVLNDDGTATSDSLSTIQAEINAALELALLQNRGEGQRCSSAVWTPSTTDILNVPEALLTGVLTLNLLGTIHSVYTNVRVVSGGQ